MPKTVPEQQMDTAGPIPLACAGPSAAPAEVIHFPPATDRL